MRRPWPVVRVRRCVVPSLCGYWVATFSLSVLSRTSYLVGARPDLWVSSWLATAWRTSGARWAGARKEVLG